MLKSNDWVANPKVKTNERMNLEQPVKVHQLRDLVNVVSFLLPSVVDLVKVAIPKEASTLL